MRHPSPVVTTEPLPVLSKWVCALITLVWLVTVLAAITEGAVGCSPWVPGLAAFVLSLLFGLGLAALFAFPISAIQAAVEYGYASIFLGLPNWRRFGAWWEGVLIGYGACALTVFFTGLSVTLSVGAGGLESVRRFWPLLLLTALESGLIQWWVVRYRARCWNDPIPGKRLAVACVGAKLVAFVCFSWMCSFRPL